MDNAAFRNLVNDRSKEKSTKEIARDAVEEEFQEKKRKRKQYQSKKRGGDYDDDSDYDDNGEGNGGRGSKKEKDQKDGGGGDDKDEYYWKQGRRVKKSKKGQQATSSGDGNGNPTDNTTNGTKYRDRAKERRLGKNLDYNDASQQNENSAATAQLNEEMTKFLGGDEAHTHLVKGLDKTLAEKVRREEMMKSGNIKNTGAADGTISSSKDRNNEEKDVDLDTVMEEAQAAIQRRDDNKNLPLDTVLRQIKPTVQSSLGKGMLSFLQKKHTSGHAQKNNNTTTTVPITNYMDTDTDTNMTAGQTILRSSLSFSLKADPRDRLNAWEQPSETILSTDGAGNGISSGRRRRQNGVGTHGKPCTTVERSLIQKIKSIFDEAKKKELAISKAKADVLGKYGSNGNSKKGKHKSKKHHGKKKNSGANVVSDDGKSKSSISKRVSKPSVATSAMDSDDDIFGDIGEYVPPSAQKIT